MWRYKIFCSSKKMLKAFKLVKCGVRTTAWRRRKFPKFEENFKIIKNFLRKLAKILIIFKYIRLDFGSGYSRLSNIYDLLIFPCIFNIFGFGWFPKVPHHSTKYNFSYWNDKQMWKSKHKQKAVCNMLKMYLINAQ